MNATCVETREDQPITFHMRSALFNTKGTKDIISSLRKRWLIWFTSFRGQISYFLFNSWCIQFATNHARSFDWFNHVTSANDPEFCCARPLNPVMRPEWMSRIIIRETGWLGGRITGCLAWNLKRECLKRPPATMSSSFNIGSNFKTELDLATDEPHLKSVNSSA